MEKSKRKKYYESWNKKRKKICCIYKIQSKMFPELIYIGSTKDLFMRKNCHLYNTRNEILKSHINKYGKDDLNFSILEKCKDYELMAKEQYYISELQPYFNTFRFASFNDLSCNLARTIAIKELSEEYKNSGVLRWLYTGENCIIQSFEDKLNLEIIPKAI